MYRQSRGRSAKKIRNNCQHVAGLTGQIKIAGYQPLDLLLQKSGLTVIGEHPVSPGDFLAKGQLASHASLGLFSGDTLGGESLKLQSFARLHTNSAIEGSFKLIFKQEWNFNEPSRLRLGLERRPPDGADTGMQQPLEPAQLCFVREYPLRDHGFVDPVESQYRAAPAVCQRGADLHIVLQQVGNDSVGINPSKPGSLEGLRRG